MPVTSDEGGARPLPCPNEALRARVRRSLEDPRPSLSAEEAEQIMAHFIKSERERAEGR